MSWSLNDPVLWVGVALIIMGLIRPLVRNLVKSSRGSNNENEEEEYEQDEYEAQPEPSYTNSQDDEVEVIKTGNLGWKKIAVIGIILLLIASVTFVAFNNQKEKEAEQDSVDRGQFCAAQVYELFNITEGTELENEVIFLAEIAANGQQPTQEQFEGVSPDARNAFVTWLSCVLQEK